MYHNVVKYNTDKSYHWLLKVDEGSAVWYVLLSWPYNKMIMVNWRDLSQSVVRPKCTYLKSEGKCAHNIT